MATQPEPDPAAAPTDAFAALSRGHAPRRLGRGGAAAVFFTAAALYVLLGIAGLTLESAQPGVSPVWPASGVAFACAYWFGPRYALVVVPALAALALMHDVLLEVAALAALGSVLEAAVPVILLRGVGLHPALRQLHDTLLFIGVAACLGPLFSASAGTLAMVYISGATIDAVNIWLLWWVGNSLGILVVGGFLLLLPFWRDSLGRAADALELLGAGLAVAAITFASTLRLEQVTSALLLYLLIPAFLLIGLRRGQLAVAGAAMVGLLVFFLVSGRIPEELRAHHEIGIFYLDLTLLWIATFSGMIVTAANRERVAREELSWLVSHDPLTGLLNRHAFNRCLEAAIASAQGGGRQHALVYLGLDRFKDINDREGHAFGDAVLREVGALLQEEVRRGDTVSRLGGDEFALLLENCDLLDACGVAENIRRAIEDYRRQTPDGGRRLEASLGVVCIDRQCGDAHDVLYGADQACGEAKRSGRNRVWVRDLAARDSA